MQILPKLCLYRISYLHFQSLHIAFSFDKDNVVRSTLKDPSGKLVFMAVWTYLPFLKPSKLTGDFIGGQSRTFKYCLTNP